MKQLKIRTKIMLWYTLLSLALLAIIIPIIYSSVSASLQQTLNAKLQFTVSQVIGCTEHEDDTTVVELKERDLEEDVALYVLSRETGTLFLSHDGDFLTEIDPKQKDITSLEHNGDTWRVLRQKFELDEEDIIIFAASSTSYLEDTLGHLLHILIWIVPFYLVASALGAYFLAKRAMAPIHAITRTAQSIGPKDMDKRIENVTSQDEVGELADTFNAMLNELEVAFLRERQFTSDASHELRTPLAIISACTEDSLAQNLPEDLQENLATIDTESQRMQRIISQLLFLSRGAEGRCHFEPEAVDLHEMVQSVADELSPLADERGITIHNETPAGTQLTADQSLMTQLLVNLIGNSIKYGSKNGNTWITSTQEADRLNLTIKDDGMGISQEDLPHIFDRFYRADKARDRSGTGLGLSIVKWIVEMHRGTITADSTLDSGTTFTICLPNQPAP